MPGNMERRVWTDGKNERGETIVNVYDLHWTHPLVERVAKMMGWWKNSGG
jgi:hypothetical protein